MIQGYINYLESVRGLSAHTSKAYGKDLRHFANWAKERDTAARWSTITREDIDAYVTERAHEGKAAATTNRALSAIAGLYDYIRRNGYDIDNPCRYESRRKIGKTLPTTIPTADLKTAYKHATGKTKILLGLLALTGARIQETLDIRFADIDAERGTIHLHGKGQKDRIVYIPSNWAHELTEQGRGKNGQARLFDWTQRDARAIIATALRPYTSATKVNPHTIRHTYATALACKGISTATIAKQLGHAQLDTTQRYIDAAQIGLANLPQLSPIS